MPGTQHRTAQESATPWPAPDPRSRRRRYVSMLVALLLAPAPGVADDAAAARIVGPSSTRDGAEPADPAPKPRAGFRPSFALRARYELGDQSGLRTAHAATLRGRLGLATPSWAGFSAFGELEATQALDATSYQAASMHGTGRGLTIIADPESSEVNRLWVDWKHEAAEIKLGRQRILLDNQRLVGNVGWRQNEQTYDAATLRTREYAGVSLVYAYVWRANRIFGSKRPRLATHGDFHARAHLIDASYAAGAWGDLGAYAYFMDLRAGSSSAASNDTFGVRLAGQIEAGARTRMGYRLELATQHDAGRSPASYRARYAHARLWGTREDGTLGVGYELLDADGGMGFQTPLATQHKFNGFADVFLATPPTGLIDRYAWLDAKLPLGIGAHLALHDFAQADSRGDLGREYDLVLSRALPFGVRGVIKYAVFTSESAGLRAVRRLVLQLEYGG